MKLLENKIRGSNPQHNTQEKKRTAKRHEVKTAGKKIYAG